MTYFYGEHQPDSNVEHQLDLYEKRQKEDIKLTLMLLGLMLLAPFGMVVIAVVYAVLAIYAP